MNNFHWLRCHIASRVVFVWALLMCGGSVGFAPTKALAETNTSKIIYASTYNLSTHASDVWRMNIADSTTNRVFTVAPLSTQSPQQAFPAQEYAKMIAAIDQGAFPKEYASAGAAWQTIQDVWALERDQLLVLTRNELCYRIQYACFGYYEFLLVDTIHTSTTSLLKVSYHHESLDMWIGYLGCNAFDTVNIEAASPNPTQSKFAFTLKPQYECAQPRSQHYVVDYAASPVNVRVFSASGNLAWSPDGSLLAYYVKDAYTNKNNVSYYGSVWLYDAATNQHTNLFSQLMSPNFSIAIGWADTHTLVYTWLDSKTGGEGEYVIFVQDIHTKVSKRLHYPPQPGQLLQLLYMQGEPPALFGTTSDPDRWLVMLPSTMKTEDVLAPFRALVSVPMRYFYNPCHSDYLLMATGSDVRNLTLMDAQMRQTTVDLGALLHLASDTYIFTLTAGS